MDDDDDASNHVRHNCRVGFRIVICVPEQYECDDFGGRKNDRRVAVRRDGNATTTAQ